jgi:DNA-binding transcriptional ArsR family regulator
MFDPDEPVGGEYNTFMQTNMSSAEEVARLLQTIGQPARLQILLAIGETETCVCHLESTLGWRQAYLSQHLMALREAGLVSDRREGRFVHYHLNDSRLLAILHLAADVQGITLPALSPSTDCRCPNCQQQECHA